MRAKLVQFCELEDEMHAVVRLEPGWLSRLLGKEPVTIALGWLSNDGERRGWFARGSGRWIDNLPHAGAIEDALDFRGSGDPPWEVPDADGKLLVPSGGDAPPATTAATAAISPPQE